MGYREQFILSMLFTGFTTLILGLFVLWRDIKNKVYVTFAFYSFSIAWWSFCQTGTVYGPDLRSTWVWARIEHVGVAFIPTFFLHFIVLFLNLKRKTALLFLSYAVSIFFMLSIPFGLVIRSVSLKLGGKIYYGNPGHLYIWLVAFFTLTIVYCLYHLFFAYKNAVGIRKNQLGYLWWGSFFGYLGGVANFLIVFDISLPVLNPYGTYLVGLYTFVVGYAIVKYQLLEMNIALTRIGIFMGVNAFFLSVPYWIGYRMLGYGRWMLPVTIMALVAMVSPFIYLYLRSRAEHVILRERHRYHSVLKVLSRQMTQIRDLDELLSLIVVTIVDNVRVDFAAIYLKEEENGRFTLKSHQPKKPPAALKETFAKDSDIIKALCERKKTHLGEELAYTIHEPELHDSLIIPFLFERELSGVLILGPKPKKYMYTSEDIIVFETLAYAASLAIENCKFWREVEDRQRKARLQEMDAYSYALAHEIDNPVQIILGQVDFLKNECSSGILDEAKHHEAAESFDFIIEAAERISGMVKAIQDYGQKTSAGQEPLFIEQIVDTFSRLYLPLFKAKGVAFEKNIDEAASEPCVLGVKPELVQIFVILANNALHGMKQSQVKKITVNVSAIGTDTARIDFIDTGCGIKAALLPIIFAPFTTTKASSEGTGMGLYNAKKIIARHNGKIWAESEGEGKGARICIELPLLHEQEGQPLETIEGGG